MKEHDHAGYSYCCRVRGPEDRDKCEKDAGFVKMI